MFFFEGENREIGESPLDFVEYSLKFVECPWNFVECPHKFVECPLKIVEYPLHFPQKRNFPVFRNPHFKVFPQKRNSFTKNLNFQIILKMAQNLQLYIYARGIFVKEVQFLL